jgi:predicted dehydrogenase
MTYQVAIIGAGKIGALLDNPDSPHVLTHAHGYSSCEDFQIAGFVDRDLKKAEAASRCWGGEAFECVEKLFQERSIDVVSVCVPDELHCETMLRLADQPLKFIFLEKPAVRSIAEANVVGSIYDRLSVRVLVNYTRRFVPEIRRIARAIKAGEFGPLVTGIGYYGKGLCHNGSHMVDLLHFLVGEVAETKKIDEIADFYQDDPSVSALLTMRNGGRFILQHIDCREFDTFELDLTFEKKRIRICELGTIIEEHSVQENAIFKGYRTMSKTTEYYTEHRKAMLYAVENIRNNLKQDEPLACTLTESFDAIDTCSKILQGR